MHNQSLFAEKFRDVLEETISAGDAGVGGMATDLASTGDTYATDNMLTPFIFGSKPKKKKKCKKKKCGKKKVKKEQVKVIRRSRIPM